MSAVQSTVCQCGHEKAIHHGELGCCSCECRKFVLPASKVVTCPTCLAGFADEAGLAEHLAIVRKSVMLPFGRRAARDR
jgi:hypothetical protein